MIRSDGALNARPYYTFGGVPIMGIKFGIALAAALLGGGLAYPAFAGGVTPERLASADAEPQNWLMVHQNYSSHRYSQLDQINTGNVKDLRLAFAVPLGGGEPGAFGLGSLEGTPLVNNGFMYVTDPWGTPYKIDVRSGNAGRIMWVADTGIDKEFGQLVTNRGLGLWNDLVITVLLDGRVVAVDDETGDVVWERQVADEQGEGFSNSPQVVGDKIIVGQSLGDWGTRGWIEALDAATGDRIWRFFTVPAPGEFGSESWQDDHNAWKTGGAAAWVSGSYEPGSNRIFWGTGNPVPAFDPEFRPGDNLFSNSALALDADSGDRIWHFQYTPGDYMDLDEVGVHILIDAEIAGELREITGHFGRNGFFYALDRNNGSFIYATRYSDILDWTMGINPRTGKPLGYDPNSPLQEYVSGKALRRNVNEDIIACPSVLGGVNFYPPAYNPKLGVMYAGGNEGCSKITLNEGGNVNEAVRPGIHFLGGDWRVVLPTAGHLTAIDIKTGQIKAKSLTKYPLRSGVLATAGDLVFAADISGTIRAYDANTLEILWSMNVGTGFKAPPMTYSFDGKQYIAILGGAGDNPGRGDMLPELANQKGARMLWVFSL